MTTKMKTETTDRAAIWDKIVAAENTRCACGNCGDWDKCLHGTSGTDEVVWAGCSNCGGSAIGYPVLLSDHAAIDRLCRELPRLAESERDAADARYVASHTHTDGYEVRSPRLVSDGKWTAPIVNASGDRIGTMYIDTAAMTGECKWFV